MLNRILFISPHLSTGGLPQYLLKKIESLKEHYDIYVVEYDNHAGVYNVQKNKIKSLVKHYPLSDNKDEILDIIDKIEPHIIHFEEIPETFINHNILKKIYTKPNRQYKIIESTHGSKHNLDDKVFYPDKFAFVTNFSEKQFKSLNIPSSVIEYPIIKQQRPERIEALKLLDLDPSYKHVLNVGLFNKNKNQAEIWNYAQKFKDEKVLFHFVGNQAGNFEDDWKPLMENKPDNCIVWGERNDVDKFYSSMDLFLFTSLLETNPLVVKEALSWNMPILMYNLPVYGNTYKDNPNINFLSSSLKNNIDKIKQALRTKVESLKELFSFSYDKSMNKIMFYYTGYQKKFRVYVRDIITNLCIYQNDMILEHNHQYVIYPTLTSYFNFYKSKKVFGFNIEFVDDELQKYEHTLNISKMGDEVNHLQNHSKIDDSVFLTYSDFFHKKILAPFKFSNRNYDTIIDIGANYGFFSQYLRDISEVKDIIFVEPNPKCHSYLESLSSKICHHPISNKIKETKFYLTSKSTLVGSLDETNQLYDDSIDVVTLDYNGLLVKYQLKGEKIDLVKIDVEGAEYDIISGMLNEDIQNIEEMYIEFHNNYHNDIQIIIDKLQDYFTLDVYHLQNNGRLMLSSQLYNYSYPNGAIHAHNKKPRFKAIHLLTKPFSERESRSQKNLKFLEKHIDYQKNRNNLYTASPPAKTCARPDRIGPLPGHYIITPAHYGCFKAHKDAILHNIDKKKYEALIIFECDAMITVSEDEFLKKVNLAYQLCKKYNLAMFTFGQNCEHPIKTFDNFYIVNRMVEAHAYLIPDTYFELYKKLFKKPWDAPDLFYSQVLKDYNIGVYHEPIALQAKGISLLDRKMSIENSLGTKKL